MTRTVVTTPTTTAVGSEGFPSGPAAAGVVRVLRDAARVASATVLTLAMVLVLALAIGPRTGQYRTVSILTGSMEPTFSPGDVVVSTPMPASRIRVGDVISFQAPVPGSPVVTHRVIEVVHGGAHPVIRTQGDANPTADPWRARIEGDTVWRQRGVVPHLGSAIHALRSPRIGHLLLYGSLVLVLAVGLFGVWAAPAEERD
jgi:signal peptidase